MSPDPIERRNAGLRRISNLTKGALAGGLVLTGGLSALAARSFSGTAAATATTTQSTASSGASTATQSTTASTTQSTTKSTTATTTPALQSPSYSVHSSSGSGRVSSGGS
jgi:hypothetical protein